MTLSLDEVRKTRFHMARRSGYEVLEVDSFVDKIEATLKALEEERDTMKRQLGAINKAGENTTGAQATTGAPVATPAAGAKDDEIAKLKSELAAAKKEAEQARQQPVTPAPAQAGQQGSAELEQLRKENAELKRQLAAKPQAAQPAAQPVAAQTSAAGQSAAAGAQRLVVTTSEEASPAVVQLVQLATQQAEAVTKQADEQAKRTISEANAKAESVNREAATRAQQTESEAKAKADKLSSDAQTRAKSLDDETNTKRSQLFSQLESERDQLAKKVEDLRSFESQYRSTLSQQLESQLSQVKSGSFEPQRKPELLTESRPAGHGTQPHVAQQHHGTHDASSAQHTTGQQDQQAATPQSAPAQQAGVGQQPTTSGQQPTSNTPRLDALLGDQKDK